MSTHWSNIVTATAAATQAFAVAVAGGFGYARFIRRRAHHSALDPTLKAELVTISTGRGIRVTAQIANTGSFRMEFPIGCAQLVTLECADQAVWTDGVTNGEVLWTSGTSRFVDLIVEEARRPVKDEALEPGQTIVRERLIPVPPGPWVAQVCP